MACVLSGDTASCEALCPLHLGGDIYTEGKGVWPFVCRVSVAFVLLEYYHSREQTVWLVHTAQ